jgi:hypothetical protein
MKEAKNERTISSFGGKILFNNIENKKLHLGKVEKRKRKEKKAFKSTK